MTKKRMREQDHPFYRPLWRRVAIVASVFLWLCFELWQGSDGLWMALALGALVYAVYTFFITYPKEHPGDDADAGT